MTNLLTANSDVFLLFIISINIHIGSCAEPKIRIIQPAAKNEKKTKNTSFTKKKQETKK